MTWELVTFAPALRVASSIRLTERFAGPLTRSTSVKARTPSRDMLGRLAKSQGALGTTRKDRFWNWLKDETFRG